MDIKRGEKICYKAARYFGQEAECNRLTLDDYKEDIAGRYGKTYQWKHLPYDVKAEAMKQFNLGRQDERNA